MLARLVFAFIVLGVVGGGAYGAWRQVARSQPLPQALALLEQGDPQGAQLVLRPLVRAEPRNAEGHVLLARTQLDLNDPVAAEKELKIARALRYERAVLNPLLAQAYMAQGRFQDVLTDVPGTVSRDVELVPNLVARARAYIGLQNLALAQATLDSAAAVAPDDAGVLLVRAKLSLARGDAEGAEQAIGRATAAAGSLDAAMLRADVLAQRGDRAGALAVMDKAVASAPYSVPTRLQRINYLIATGQYKRAQADVDASFKVDWHDPGVLMANAELMIHAGRLADATSELQRLASLMDRFPRGYFLQALTAFRMGQFESGLDIIARFLKVRPEDTKGLRLAATLEEKLERPERTLVFLARAEAAGANDGETYDMQGRAHFMLGQLSDAVESYRKAAAVDPQNAEYAAHLAAARSLIERGRGIAAREADPVR